MKPFYIATNGNGHKVPGGVGLNLEDIKLIGDYSRMSDGSGFNVYLDDGQCIPILFSPDVSVADGLEKHSLLMHDWLLVNQAIPFDVEDSETSVVALEDPNGTYTQIARTLALLVCWLTKEGVEKEDKQAWALVEEFALNFLEGQPPSITSEYYRTRDADIEL